MRACGLANGEVISSSQEFQLELENHQAKEYLNECKQSAKAGPQSETMVARWQKIVLK